ncbi:DegT/DnrJ/EryC1/StrS family aminotransferase [Ferrovibrio xuzhouensis]|uniref:DegT/DnrJ/EryC1/StrS family aminotransferase n=1 Tax=Ferrovibrio xuzhouensis TaxID=1576914 RepID=A0ABV7VCJ4_9PROT
MRELVRSGDFTLGKVVGEFEAMFAEAVGVRHAIGVGSGTDALKIPLKALGIGPGDEVITTANTFWATVGAIAEAGARPVFVDCDDSFCMDVAQLDGALTSRTRAIMPVHLTGDVTDMPKVMAFAERHGLAIVEDGCQSLMAQLDGQPAGTFGVAAGFSMHPLKIINVWGDAGVVVTNDDEMDRKCRLLRNHGLRNRDEMEILGYNSRLDSVQAVVGKWILRQIEDIVRRRAENAAYYDAGLRDVAGIRLPPRNPRVRNVYLLYMFFAERRDALLEYLVAHGVEAKVHYPVPIYQQDALRFLGHKAGDFPVTDRHAREVITLPVDQHLSVAELDHVIETVRNFYSRK